MKKITSRYAKNLGSQIHTIYKQHGLIYATTHLLEELKKYYPIVRINLICVIGDTLKLFTIGDTYHALVQNTHENVDVSPLLANDLIDKAIYLEDISKYIDKSIDRKKWYNIPSLLHKSLVRIPFVSSRNHYFLFNFWSDTLDGFHVDALDEFSKCIEVIAEDIIENYNNNTINPEFIATEKEDNILNYKSLEEVKKKIFLVAPTGLTVLILGETGSGKERIADEIHKASTINNAPYIKVNCGAIPESLLESELFGREKGAFTGAISTQKGYFEHAHNGTILLDEIGELSPSAQVSLLRVLDSGVISRVGNPEPIPINVRVLAATHVDLEKKVREGSFRQDLWYRLNIYPIHAPPLRARKADIIPLVKYFIKKQAPKLGIINTSINKKSEQALLDYDWQGNIRELQHVVTCGLIQARGNELSKPLEFKVPKNTCKNTQTFDVKREKELKTLEEITNEYIQFVLERTNGKLIGKNSASEILGIHYTTLKKKMKWD